MAGLIKKKISHEFATRSQSSESSATVTLRPPESAQ